jgi:transposase
MATSRSDFGVGSVREELARMFDAGDKHKLLETVEELLVGALRQVNTLSARVAELTRQLYGSKQERISPHQLALALAELRQEQTQPESSADKPDEPAVPDKPSDALPRLRQRKRGGRRPLPAHLQREEIRIEPTEEQLAATSGGMRKMSEERSEVLEYVPAQFKVLVYVREVWSNAVGEIVTAPAPDKIIDKGLPGPGLLTQVVVVKYRDHVPLARQTGIYQRAGVELSRNTLVDWVAAVAFLFEALARLILQRAMQSHVLQVDDTKIPVQDRRKAKNIKSGHLWALIGDRRYVAYRYTDNWRAETAVALLGERIGWMQVDAYKGYEQVFARGLAIEVGCWMHARRYFVRAFERNDLRAAKPIDLIREMYKIEAASKEAGESHQARLERRQRDMKPLIDELRAWLDKHQGCDVPSSPLSQAITYADNQWVALLCPLYDGSLEIDNGEVERALRGTALGRKNWLFAGSDEGAERAAIIKTVIDTAVHHGVDVWQYVHDVLIKLSAGWPMRRLEELLPENWRTLHAPPSGDAVRASSGAGDADAQMPALPRT